MKEQKRTAAASVPAVEAAAAPVRLAPSGNGWRVAEFSLPN